MSEGKKIFILTLIALGLLCLTILYVFLFFALWSYKEAVGLSLLGIVVLAVLVYLRGKLNEQNLRWTRIKQNEEIPLDQHGEPCYLPEGAQPNPYRVLEAQHYQSSAYQSRQGSYGEQRQ